MVWDPLIKVVRGFEPQGDHQRHHHPATDKSPVKEEREIEKEREREREREERVRFAICIQQSRL